jgi:hypothetical protein
MLIDPLVVRIIDTLTGESWVYLFPVGPVTIGRGADCSLQIDRPFISAHQGSFQFDDHSVRFQDGDPRSGTRVDGVPAGGREKTVTDWTQIEMGDLRMTTSRRPPDQPVADPSLSPFARPQAGAAAPLRAHDPVVTPQPAPSRPPRSKQPAAKVSAPPVRSRSSRSVERPPRRRVKRRFSILAWLSAIALGTAAVAAAGLVLQFRGLPWMPPELLSRIPPWLADWSGHTPAAVSPPDSADPATKRTTLTPTPMDPKAPHRSARSRR